MTTVAIVPVPGAGGEISFQAIAGDKQSRGKTAGEALDALTSQLPEGQAGLMVVIQGMRPDRFFNAAQQQRLAELMTRWRAARNRGETLPPGVQSELDALVEAELRASAERAATLADAAQG